MWPWEHLVFGYLCYSGGRRAAGAGRPGERDTYALVFATQFPDLIDKPLAWTFDVLPSGISLAHSLVFAVPLCLVVGALTWHRARAVGVAFAIGYASHLAGDGLYPLFTDGAAASSFLFWPFVSRPPVEDTEFLLEVSHLFARFQEFLGTPRGRAYLLAEVVVLLLVLALWARDGLPGTGLLRAPREILRRARS